MRKPALMLVSLALLVVVAAGCGGSSGGGGGGGSSSGGSGHVADSAKLANCLNNNDWITSPTGNDVSGNSAGGAGVDIVIFPTPAAAKAAAAKKPKKSTTVVETSMVSFLGTVSATGPAPPAPINKADLATVKTCISQS